MTRSGGLAWFLLAVWAVWFQAFEGWCSASLGAWTPSFGIVLACSLAARWSTSSLLGVALCVGLARAALSIDSVEAVLACHLGAVLVVRVVRSVLEVTSPPIFASLCAAIGAGATIWLALVRESRLVHTLALPDGAIFDALRAAFATAIAALVLGPWMAYLPGLSPLKRSSPWSSADSRR
jgi:hypothetical protein